MKIIIEYNKWRAVHEVPDGLARSSRLQLDIMPPLAVDCNPSKPPKNPFVELVVYNTCRRENGMPVFSNDI